MRMTQAAYVEHARKSQNSKSMVFHAFRTKSQSVRSIGLEQGLVLSEPLGGLRWS